MPSRTEYLGLLGSLKAAIFGHKRFMVVGAIGAVAKDQALCGFTSV